jgi:hypothetical protein
MIDTATPATHAGARRTWLGDTQPTAIEPDDEWLTDVTWGPDADAAIAQLRAQDPAVDALFRIAERDGLAIIPVWPDEHSDPHPLTELASSTVDTDWIMVCAKEPFRPSFTAEMIVDPLAPASYTRHRTPTWLIYITAH